MSVDSYQFLFEDLQIRVLRKKVKHISLRIRPPAGQLEVTTPIFLSEKDLHRLLADKLPWIRRKQAQLQQNQDLRPLDYLAGEKIAYLGQDYPLQIAFQAGRARLSLVDNQYWQLTCPQEFSRTSRAALFDAWYRQTLTQLLPNLFEKWEQAIGQSVNFWGIKKMKTRWGSCNPSTRRIWLNLELAKYPIACIEYVVVHELVHLLEPSHNQRFKALMSQYLPQWPALKAQLRYISVN